MWWKLWICFKCFLIILSCKLIFYSRIIFNQEGESGQMFAICCWAKEIILLCCWRFNSLIWIISFCIKLWKFSLMRLGFCGEGFKRYFNDVMSWALREYLIWITIYAMIERLTSDKNWTHVLFTFCCLTTPPQRPYSRSTLHSTPLIP